MKKKFILAGFLLLFACNPTTAVAPSKSQQITGFVPVQTFGIKIPTETFIFESPIPRATPKILKPPVSISYTKTVAAAKAYALDKLGPVQFACLDKLFTRESHWRTTAHNSSSGAYGIPQALPGSKMAAAGSDWKTNPVTQVRWAITIYIPNRYGAACKAWEHSQKYGWY